MMLYICEAVKRAHVASVENLGIKEFLQKHEKFDDISISKQKEVDF